MLTNQEMLTRAYQAFNERDIDAVLQWMHPDVDWPNGMEGGRVRGHQGVRDYWTRQWKMIYPHVEPISIKDAASGHIVVEVHQVVYDLDGNLLGDQVIQHVYQIEDGLIKSMEIIK